MESKQTTSSKILRWVIFPFIFVLLQAPNLGLIFVVCFIISAISNFFWGFIYADLFFWLGLKIYLVLSIFTLAIAVTHEFQQCCIGFLSFRRHLRHRSLKDYLRYILCAFIWPLYWVALDDSLKRFDIRFADVVLMSLKYWFFDSRKEFISVSLDMRKKWMKKFKDAN